MSAQPRPSVDLLNHLCQRTDQNLAIARQLNELPDQLLLQKPTPESWNALECLAHLNHYGAYYLPEIRRQITASKYQDDGQFLTGRLGNYFANTMKPGVDSKKVKTLASADPTNFKNSVDRKAVDVFIADQLEMLELLDLAGKVSLTKTKTGISIVPLLKLRLGDTLRVVVNHNWRHIEQALRAVDQA